MKKVHRRKLREVADLLVKRDVAALFERKEEMAELRPMIEATMAEVLDAQDQIPGVISSTDTDMILCLLGSLSERYAGKVVITT